MVRGTQHNEIVMDENQWKVGFTKINVRISKEVDGDFSIFDGSVTGTNWNYFNWNNAIRRSRVLVSS
jgi:hypothetical protein